MQKCTGAMINEDAEFARNLQINFSNKYTFSFIFWCSRYRLWVIFEFFQAFFQVGVDSRNMFQKGKFLKCDNIVLLIESWTMSDCTR